MARKKVRSGVRSTMAFLRRQIVAGRKVIREAVVRLNQLKRVDRRVRRLEAELKRSKQKTRQSSSRSTIRRPGKSNGLRGHGPSVVCIALHILEKKGVPMGIAELAAQVLAKKKGKAGANFTQNLGAQLMRQNTIFKRVSRGVYGLRRSTS